MAKCLDVESVAFIHAGWVVDQAVDVADDLQDGCIEARKEGEEEMVKRKVKEEEGEQIKKKLIRRKI